MENKTRNSDPVLEIKIQKQQELNLTLTNKIAPHKNHILYEYNTKTGLYKVAEFMPSNKVIHWFDAVKGNFKKTREVINKENCIYISCLNKENLAKILKRNYGINLTP